MYKIQYLNELKSNNSVTRQKFANLVFYEKEE